MTQVEKVLSRLSTTYIASLYIGGNPYLGEMEHPDSVAFIEALEVELDRRGLRSLDNNIGWNCATLSDDELDYFEQYLEEIWDDIRDGMLKSLREGKAKKASAVVQKERA
jgi:hypothetical protein